MVYEWVEEACRAGGRVDKIVQLKWERCVGVVGCVERERAASNLLLLLASWDVKRAACAIRYL